MNRVGYFDKKANEMISFEHSFLVDNKKKTIFGRLDTFSSVKSRVIRSNFRKVQ